MMSSIILYTLSNLNCMRVSQAKTLNVRHKIIVNQYFYSWNSYIKGNRNYVKKYIFYLTNMFLFDSLKLAYKIPLNLSNETITDA